MAKKSGTLTITHHLLLQQFNHRVAIPVEEIAEPYLNLARRTALNRAREHKLPFPCFKMGDSNKSPYVVHLNDLVNYIDRRVEEERNIWEKFHFRSAA
ncbi:TPA: pyocin activator PrtN family protein [Vibrio parahaemolyticus]|uniref:pyocin activator PrtN family protein n=1 Tax=Vibrio parahaemolyticus TaxID=670 RepID=UPI0011231C8A|nr:pyocin activator PrtN family protein [Vibrio parahaemolyticus]MCG7792188.1 pyocin activator PrtN family protein [Vibrio parahaemolyticus]TOH11320.1 hypothetical protein CGI90_18015 [Vibrio parahaemolyticus]HCG6477556.1 pyocin activator PrtN family protein [Vibrio parahaemolyticus]